jgi:hypothetical protein
LQNSVLTGKPLDYEKTPSQPVPDFKIHFHWTETNHPRSLHQKIPQKIHQVKKETRLLFGTTLQKSTLNQLNYGTTRFT